MCGSSSVAERQLPKMGNPIIFHNYESLEWRKRVLTSQETIFTMDLKNGVYPRFDAGFQSAHHFAAPLNTTPQQ